MQFDVFFSISQTPVDGHTPSERVMFENFFSQVKAADNLGYNTAWVAESHLSSQIQKQHEKPVVPHWEGEVGLNGDIFQLAHKVFASTRRIEVGSAVMNILCNGGPIAAAEKAATFCALHGVDPAESRRLHVGFSGGRFEFMNRPFGILPRNEIEAAAWPALRGLVFWEAAEIFARLLRGDVLSSDDSRETILTRANFRSDEDWDRVQQAASTSSDSIEIEKRFHFDVLQIVPRDWRRELLQLIIGSHDPRLQEAMNEILPVQVFNLSITDPKKIEDTHTRMSTAYHTDGGAWQRSYMPRTTFVFINDNPSLSAEQKRAAAHDEARAALGAYWKALQGTLDPEKVEKAATNALIGNPDDIIAQAKERFHPNDRLMLWFDFFNHDNDRVISNMESFMHSVAPHLSGDE
ncbi:MAG: LLM class flavin-dependent oxidoreductase [Myxococcota bacterium]|nr:LLM class flavin-dependent oxidoreductase [Myxococcota bacterium]